MTLIKYVFEYLWFYLYKDICLSMHDCAFSALKVLNRSQLLLASWHKMQANKFVESCNANCITYNWWWKKAHLQYCLIWFLPAVKLRLFVQVRFPGVLCLLTTVELSRVAVIPTTLWFQLWLKFYLTNCYCYWTTKDVAKWNRNLSLTLERVPWPIFLFPYPRLSVNLHSC